MLSTQVEQRPLVNQAEQVHPAASGPYGERLRAWDIEKGTAKVPVGRGSSAGGPPHTRGWSDGS